MMMDKKYPWTFDQIVGSLEPGQFVDVARNEGMPDAEAEETAEDVGVTPDEVPLTPAPPPTAEVDPQTADGSQSSELIPDAATLEAE